MILIAVINSIRINPSISHQREQLSWQIWSQCGHNFVLQWILIHSTFSYFVIIVLAHICDNVALNMKTYIVYTIVISQWKYDSRVDIIASKLGYFYDNMLLIPGGKWVKAKLSKSQSVFTSAKY